MPGENAPRRGSAAVSVWPLVLSRGRWVEAGASSLGVRLESEENKGSQKPGEPVKGMLWVCCLLRTTLV